jgi:hypothetical protein
MFAWIPGMGPSSTPRACSQEGTEGRGIHQAPDPGAPDEPSRAKLHHGAEGMPDQTGGVHPEHLLHREAPPQACQVLYRFLEVPRVGGQVDGVDGPGGDASENRYLQVGVSARQGAEHAHLVGRTSASSPHDQPQWAGGAVAGKTLL